MKKCTSCEVKAKWLPQCDECGENFCLTHLKQMDGGDQLCADCVIENTGYGSPAVPRPTADEKGDAK